MGEDFNLRYILYTELSSHNYIGKSNESSQKGMSPRQVGGESLIFLYLCASANEIPLFTDVRSTEAMALCFTTNTGAVE